MHLRRNRHPAAIARSSGRIFNLFAPVLALGALAAVLAFLAGLSGWYSRVMMPVAGGIGIAAALLAMGLAYRLRARSQASDQALHNVEAQVGGILDSAMDGIITVNEEQRIVQYNSAAEKMFRWPRAAVLGQPLDMLLPQRFRSAHREHIEQFGMTGVTSRRMGLQTVVSGLRASGEEFPVEASISQVTQDGKKLFTVILRDIAERVGSERLLARSEARLRGILDSAMDAIITVDDDQKIVLFNAAAEAVFGCPRDQAIGAPLSWFIPERFRGDHSAHIRRFGETGTPARRMGAQRIVTGLRRNGEEFPIDASISHITEESGSKFYTVILRDVTERVRAEQALKQSKEDLRELAAMSQSLREREKSHVARELHDELAQALTALKMDVSWIAERLPPGNTPVSAKVSTVLSLLDATVAATRRISSDLRPLLLDDLGLVPAIEWLVQNFTQRSGVACELAMGSGSLDLEEPYASAVFRIVQESLTNVARHARATQVEVTFERTDSAIGIRVRDNGRGFSASDPRKPKTFGLMGLRERAGLLGGEATVESEPGRGTTVIVTLPMEDKALQP